MKKTKVRKLVSKLVVALGITAFSFCAQAQNITAYEDYKDYFFVFDNGVKIQLDYRKVHAYQVGYSSVAYLNSFDELWVYQNGKQEKVIEWSKTFQQTDNFLVFGDNGFLNVYDNGATKLLSYQTGKTVYGDSIIAYYDVQNQSVNVYYNDSIYPIETDLISSPKYMKAGENIVAYLSPQNYFLAFYKGEIVEIMYTDDHIDFKCGLNIIAFIKPEIETFNVFYNGEEEEIDEYLPLSYKCGDNMVVYVNSEGFLMQFYKGKKHEITSFAPPFYKVVDDMVYIAYKTDCSLFMKVKISN